MLVSREELEVLKTLSAKLHARELMRAETEALDRLIAKAIIR